MDTQRRKDLLGFGQHVAEWPRGGDLSDGHAQLRETMSGLTLMTPVGKRSLDENRQVITDIFVSEVKMSLDGDLVTTLVKTIPQVSQTLGEDRDTFLAYGPVGRDNPECQ